MAVTNCPVSITLIYMKLAETVARGFLLHQLMNLSVAYRFNSRIPHANTSSFVIILTLAII